MLSLWCPVQTGWRQHLLRRMPQCVHFFGRIFLGCFGDMKLSTYWVCLAEGVSCPPSPTTFCRHQEERRGRWAGVELPRRPLPTPPGVTEQGEAARGEKKYGARFRSRDEAELIQGKVIRA